jgi:drug/metabolite transporter (DMT)-like permease
MDIVLALLAAISFAVGTVLQQKGDLEATAVSGHSSWLVQILRKPIWLGGLGFQVAGWILQAVALNKGPLTVVQSITTLSLVIALPFGAWLTGQRITPPVALGAAAIVVGIVLFLSVGSPKGGTAHPSAQAWWTAGLIILALVVALGLLGRGRTGAAKALLFGSAAGFGYAMQSAVTKEFTTLVGQGLATIVTSWTVYVLIVSALVGFVLQQSALKTGVLAPAMASSNAITLFGSVILGVTVYGETISSAAAHRGVAILGLLLAAAGIALMAWAAGPSTGEAPSSAGLASGAPTS